MMLFLGQIGEPTSELSFNGPAPFLEMGQHNRRMEAHTDFACVRRQIQPFGAVYPCLPSSLDQKPVKFSSCFSFADTCHLH